jgi:4-oxalocrotonate tautomerase
VPIVTIKMLEGRTPEIKEQVVKELTDVCVRVLKSNPEDVRVLIEEMQKSHYAKGGVLYSKMGK